MINLDHIPTTQIPFLSIVPSRWQPRQAFDQSTLAELASSVQRHGLSTPILVFINEAGQHELVAGERRSRARFVAEQGNTTRALTSWAEYAASAIFWTTLADESDPVRDLAQEITIPARIIEQATAQAHQGQLRELALVDNLQRVDLSALERAQAIHDLMVAGDLTQKDVANRLGISQPTVSQWLSLLRLAEPVQIAVAEGQLSAAAAAEVASVPRAAQAALVDTMQDQRMGRGEDKNTRSETRRLANRIKRILNLDRYAVPDDKTIGPRRRNGLRLLRLGLEQADQETIDAYVRHVTNSRAGLLGSHPSDWTWAVESLVKVLFQNLQDTEQGHDSIWTAIAIEQRWTCEHCQLQGLQDLKRAPGLDIPCYRAIRGTHVLQSCPYWTDVGQELVIPMNWRLCHEWPEELRDQLRETDIDQEIYISTIEAFQHGYNLVAARAIKEEQDQAIRRTRGHLSAMLEYQNLLKGGRFVTNHFLSHVCERCTHWRPENAEEYDGGVPCLFAAEPLKRASGLNEGTRGPVYAALISHAGLLVPRCEMFRLATEHFSWLGLGPDWGWKIGDRDTILDILAAIWTSDHGRGMWGILSWLPYPRKHGERMNLGRLQTWLKRNWAMFGDNGIALLLQMALSERIAIQRWSGYGQKKACELKLPRNNPPTQWIGLSLGQVLGREQGLYGYPEDWPQPWKDQADG